jgi:hypothetical protein
MLAKVVRSHAAVIVLMLMLAGCGSDASGDSTSGLDGSKKLADLTYAEMGQFCDWAMNKFGGYSSTCPTWGFMSYPDRTSCINDVPNSATAPTCQATVSQGEACVNAIPRCVSYQQLKNTPSCSPITDC